MSLYWGSSFALLHQNTPEMTARERGEKTKKPTLLLINTSEFSSPKIDITQHCTSLNEK